MWTLVIIAFFWLPSSSDSGALTTVNGFSSEETCKAAGEKMREVHPIGRKFGPGKDKKWRSDITVKDVYFSYECLEVK